MKSIYLPSLFSVALVALSGCSSVNIESKKIDYKSASRAQVPTLEVPPDLTSPTRDDRFLVPDSGGKGSASYSAYSGERSPQAANNQPSAVLPQIDKAYVERDGSQRWLVVSVSPDKVWGTVKDFWQELGFVINVDLPEAGVMETDWAENRAKIGQDFLRNMLGKLIDSIYSTAERDKFRTRLEPGKTPGTTEIYISHRGMYETYISEGRDQTRWQPRAADPDLEAEMLRRLMIYFGSDQKRAESEIMQAKNVPTKERARISTKNGVSVVEVQESFDRAWRRIGLALDRGGFTVEDRDRTKGIYYVRYVDPEKDGSKKEDGFLSKLNFWKSTEKPQIQYQIQVKSAGNVTTAQVLSPTGTTLDSTDTAKKILGLLHGQLK